MPPSPSPCPPPRPPQTTPGPMSQWPTTAAVGHCSSRGPFPPHIGAHVAPAAVGALLACLRVKLICLPAATCWGCQANLEALQLRSEARPPPPYRYGLLHNGLVALPPPPPTVMIVSEIRKKTATYSRMRDCMPTR